MIHVAGFNLTDYDGSEWITRVRGLTAGGAALTDLSYTYQLGSAASQDRTVVQTMKDNLANQTTYTYGGLSRLTRAQTKDAGQAVTRTYDYTYDANGNRTRASTDGTGVSAAFNAADPALLDRWRHDHRTPDQQLLGHVQWTHPVRLRR